MHCQTTITQVLFGWLTSAGFGYKSGRWLNGSGVQCATQQQCSVVIVSVNSLVMLWSSYFVVAAAAAGALTVNTELHVIVCSRCSDVYMCTAAVVVIQ